MTPSEILSTYPNVEGYVYFVRDYGFIKIGFSNNPYIRMQTIATPNAEMVHIIATNQPRGLESVFHSRFADKQQSGEWFDLHPNDLDAIREISFVESANDLPDYLQPVATSVGFNRTKKKQGVGRKPNRTGENLFVYINPELHKELMEFLESHRPRITKTALVQAAMERYLREAGCWED